MSDTPKTFARPLSPHLQVYRLPMTALMSITHRITGAILSGGFILIAAFLVCAAIGADCFNAVMGFAASPLGLFIMIGWSAVLYYHTLNGIRHLIWDMKVDTITEHKAVISGWFIITASVLLTAATWYFAA